MRSFSGDRTARSTEDYDEGYQEWYLTGKKFTQEAGRGVDQSYDQTAADGDTRWNFQDIDQERRKDKVSRPQKAGEHSGDNRKHGQWNRRQGDLVGGNLVLVSWRGRHEHDGHD